MDSPPHILKPLRTILLETASEEEVSPYLQDFYLESAECRFRPLAKNFKELKMLDPPKGNTDGHYDKPYPLDSQGHPMGDPDIPF